MSRDDTRLVKVRSHIRSRFFKAGDGSQLQSLVSEDPPVIGRLLDTEKYRVWKFIQIGRESETTLGIRVLQRLEASGNTQSLKETNILEYLSKALVHSQRDYAE